ncbi:hypothetical protein Aph01nite_80420 [Acrocarpospora phusangensis]|uniref:S1 motif domain-containing protein n=1 Tax=Acrocarpospora phusangensis TaxID=1070424 RepID=A0A919USY4_9ACTN|nr:S1 RNA-binding domain-containing protein [Acrocarpospora phusangensis]GIH29732.1 hypothetical protein Aph01nite_80420 [Acrocarpospora phusangensis]
MVSINEGGDCGAERVFLDSLEVGQVIKGSVSLMTDFGAYVDLGPMEGLIRSLNLSWSRINHPSEVVCVGQEVTVTILHIDLADAQILLSRKSLLHDPFQDFARTQLGNLVEGRVTKVTPIGLFVEVGEGVEGLLPESELTKDGVGSSRGVLKAGDHISVEVATINYGERRVALRFP